MFTPEIMDMIENLGMLWIEVPVKHVMGQTTFTTFTGRTMVLRTENYPTLIRWLRDTREVRGDDIYILFTPDHSLVVCGDWIVDNHLKVPAPYEKIKHMRRVKVNKVMCIMKEESEG